MMNTVLNNVSKTDVMMNSALNTVLKTSFKMNFVS